MRYFHNTALALALIGCGEGRGIAPESDPVEIGGAPVYIEAGEVVGAVEVEPGYGWAVLHCIENSGQEVCGDASHLYQSHDGFLCGPMSGDVFTGDDAFPVPDSSDCKVLTVGFGRFVRVH